MCSEGSYASFRSRRYEGRRSGWGDVEFEEGSGAFGPSAASTGASAAVEDGRLDSLILIVFIAWELTLSYLFAEGFVTPTVERLPLLIVPLVYV